MLQVYKYLSTLGIAWVVCCNWIICQPLLLPNPVFHTPLLLSFGSMKISLLESVSHGARPKTLCEDTNLKYSLKKNSSVFWIIFVSLRVIYLLITCMCVCGVFTIWSTTIHTILLPRWFCSLFLPKRNIFFFLLWGEHLAVFYSLLKGFGKVGSTSENFNSPLFSAPFPPLLSVSMPTSLSQLSPQGTWSFFFWRTLSLFYFIYVFFNIFIVTMVC